MAKLTGVVIFTVICFLIHASGTWLLARLVSREHFLYSFFTSLVIMFWVLGLTYKSFWTFEGFKKRLVSRTILWALMMLALSINLTILQQCRGYFQHLTTTEGKHWSGTVFIADATIGHRPIPCSNGLLTLNYQGKRVHEIPVKHDEGGFRIADTASCQLDTSHPKILFLGCSFTEGADCRNEETFASLTAKEMQARSLNAGVSSYGYGQLLAVARELIPAYQPDYVVVQFSPWLGDRAADRYAPSYGLRIPSPYFIIEGDSIRLVRPAYPSRLFSMKWESDPARGKLSNFLSFVLQEGYSAYAYDDWHYLKALFTTPSPVTDRAVLEKFYLQQVGQIVSQGQAQMIVLNLGDLQYTRRSHQYAGAGVRYAEADSLMWARVGNKETDYGGQYYFWGKQSNGDSVVIDKHPSRQAHRVIADAIIQALQ